MASFDVEDIFDQDVPEVGIGSKDVEKQKANLQKDGFRAGLSEGQEGELQTGFNQAFSRSTILLQKISTVRGQICAYLSLNHIYSADQKRLTDDTQKKLEDLLQNVQTFEHTCLNASETVLEDGEFREWEREVEQKVQEFSSQLCQITQRK
ncbi:uncharacterized protein LOC133188372 [Saccostrea echinata]|uniref:uncharacterized protein LOC133188372 n=1 Tax=Saccostrea echinata TaxID=191078 RepID=UPI002A833DF1|nr:uncharacterized protein LOC133188372 [Saccostrea echinata]XP_061179746.1 uncharacterized protein LOC133188372 [Saccostrea echinata]